MPGALSFELLKLRKRTAVWVLGATLALVVVFFDYFQLYSSVNALQEGGNDPTGLVNDIAAFKEYLLPGSVTVNVAGLLSQFGGPIALILGALAAGGEYGWGTLKTLLTQGPGRLAALSGKLLAVGVVVSFFSLLALAVGAASSYAVAGLWDEPVVWPPAGNVLRSLGVIWLILGAWAALGVFLAVLFRGTALAVGLGLVYGLAVENLVFGFSDTNEVVEALADALLVKNGSDLANSLGEVPRVFVSPEAAEPATAALVLGGYVVGLLLLAALLFRRRDVA